MLGIEPGMAIDPALRLLIAAAAAEWATRRLGGTSPAVAHAAWRVVLLLAVVLPVATVLVPPAALLRLRPSAAAVVPGAPGALSALTLVYLAGVAIGVARLVYGLCAVRQLRRRAAALGGADLARVERLAVRSSPAARATGFLETGVLRAPATIGCLSPVVLLPAPWRAWSDERLAAVLRHELAHVERRDYVLNLVATAVRLAWWWHPAAWLMARRLSLTAEMICDAHASDGRGAAAYASDLLSIARRTHPSASAPAWVPGATSGLTARIDAILQERALAPRRRRGVRVVTALAVLAVAVTIPLRVDPFGAAAPPAAAGVLHDRAHGAAHALSHGGH